MGDGHQKKKSKFFCKLQDVIIYSIFYQLAIKFRKNIEETFLIIMRFIVYNVLTLKILTSINCA